MTEEFNLNDERMELYREMCALIPNFKWGLLFEKIKNQDKEFIKRLKEEINKQDIWRVVNGKAPKELIKAFNEGELTGKEARKNLDLKIIDEFAGEELI